MNRIVVFSIVVSTGLLISPGAARATPQNTPPRIEPVTPLPPSDSSEGGPAGAAPLRLGSAVVTGSAWFDANKITDDVEHQATDTFRVRRARIGIAGNLTSRIGWNISGELTADPVLRNAFLSMQMARYLTVRVGQATPIASLERAASPLLLELIDRSHATNELTGPLDIGITLFNVEPYRHWLSYALNVSNGSGFNRPDNNDAKDVSGRLAIAPPALRHLSVVVSGARGDQPKGRRERASVGVDYNSATFHVMAEGLRQRRDNLPVSDGFFVMTALRIRPAKATEHYQMTELAVRLSVLRDPATAAGNAAGVPNDDGSAPTTAGPGIITTRELQAGVNYYVNRGMRLMTNVVIPMDARQHPGPTLRSRLQLQF